MYYKATEEVIPRSNAEVNELIDKVTEARNSMIGKRGLLRFWLRLTGSPKFVG